MSRDSIPPALRRQVRKRANFRCEYCGHPELTAPVTLPIDHLSPVAAGGVTALENLALACPWCNGAKGFATVAMDPQSREQVALFNPRVDHWNDHFRWSRSKLRILGTSPTGRATVRRLRMNRHGTAQIRRLLLALGLHPSQ
jgi:5-methylcytosine-specific restriction endonuclease McrA